ncbi:NAD(P)-dependent alcohol dehydrogenase [Paenibacillus abyssi]|uniref:Sorbitol dehydrogenase n=1 Tax=Paenibacillus abyssi TaxID=1340531 RepID=A0A917FSV0_9BACL|nr:NAD(P)-dependent alcohol dehydrogenase [Paenibacillus abyssi]GGF98891.1 sorbitol dehydrogenase [Paenibacillus abyssi]
MSTIQNAHEAIPKTMRAAVMPQPFDIVIEERNVPEASGDEVLVKIMAVGICGSDIHYYEHGRIGPYVVEKPIILGHECAGIVAAVGDKVTRFKVGDRVAVEPGITCGRCDHCKSGRYNLCADVQFLATPPVDGAFVQYIKHREDFLFPIPDGMSFETAALIEPFSVGIHAAKRAGIKPGETVAIIGMGPVGLMAVVAAKAFGAGKIIVSDMEPVRLKAAIKLGAHHALDASKQDAAEVIKDLTGGKGADVAFETAGHPHALKTALRSLCRGGRLSIVGLPPQEEIPVNVPSIADNEIDIYGVFRYANTYAQGITFISSGIADTDIMITDRYPLEQTKEAMERARTNKSGSLKVVVYPNGM